MELLTPTVLGTGASSNTDQYAIDHFVEVTRCQPEVVA